MKIRFFAVALAAMVIALPLAMAGQDCINCDIYKGYLTGDMKLWERGMNDLQQSYNREAYRRALRRAPDFEWVRDELLPAVGKKIK